MAARKTEFGYVIWHPEHGFMMWTLAGRAKRVRELCAESAPWKTCWINEGWRVVRIKISIQR